jgi:hypothetical protein
MEINLKFRKDKFTKTRGTPAAPLSLVSSLNYLQRLIDVTMFRLSKALYSLSVLFERANNLASTFTNGLDHIIYQTKFATHIRLFFSHFPFVV